MFYSYKNCQTSINNQPLWVTQADLSIGAALDPNYYADIKHNDGYAASDGIGGSLRLSYYYNYNEPLQDFINNERLPITGDFAGLVFRSGYLKSFSLQGSPNQKAIANAEIVFFTAPTGTFNPSFDGSQNFTVLNFSDAVVNDLQSGKLGDLENITNFRYSFTSEINPLYNAGESTPVDIHFGKKEAILEIETDNLSGFLPITGRQAGIQLTFAHPTVPEFNKTLKCEGILFQREISSSINNTLASVISIKQNALGNPPSIVDIDTSPVFAGDLVTIVGSNFSNVTTVTIKNEPVDFQIEKDTILKFTVPAKLSKGKVAISNLAGTTTSDTILDIVYDDIQINNVTPLTGYIGSKVLISGENFYDINAVYFGDYSGQFTAFTHNTIEAVVPNTAAWDFITVESSLRGSTGYSPFAFVPIPQIDGFSPTTGAVDSFIEITGQGFSGVQYILYNAYSSTPVQINEVYVNSNSGISVHLPSGNISGIFQLVGQSGVRAYSPYPVFPSAVLTGLSPSSSFTGDSIELLGNSFIREFMHEVSSNKFLVTFEGGATGEFERINSQKLSGVVPSGAQSGLVHINRNLFHTHHSNTSWTPLYREPVISTVIPPSGRYLDYVSLVGENFANITNIQLSGRTGISTVSSFSTSKLSDVLSFQIPNITGDFYNITVNTSSYSVTKPSGIFVMQVPFVSGIFPTSGVPGEEITLSGLNIFSIGNVYLGNTGNLAFKVENSWNVNNSQIKFYVPNLNGDLFNVIFYNGVDYHTGSTQFKYLRPPSISGFTPTTGKYGDVVTISGRNFENATGVYISDFSASFNVINSTGLYVTIPENSLTGPIRVLSKKTETSTQNFSIVYPSPIISGFFPPSGRRASTLTISGSYLNTIHKINFSGETEPVSVRSGEFTSSTPSQIVLSVPNGAVSGQLQLLNTDWSISPTTGFKVILDPVITDFRSQSGVYNSSIWINGRNFENLTFFFNGVSGLIPATHQLTSSGASITVPRELVAGPIEISGDSSFYSYTSQDFTPLPTLSGVNLNIPTGGTFLFTGVNATSISSFLGITGGNNSANIVNQNQIFTNLHQFTGTQVATGYTIISGRINDNFIGTGRLFLLHSSFSGGTGISGFLSSPLNNTIDSFASNFAVTITQPSPIVNSLSPSRGDFMTPVSANGRHFKSVLTGYFLQPITLTNAGFETLGTGGADVFSDWEEITSSNSSISVETPAFSGSYSAKLERPGAGSCVIQQANILTPYRNQLLRCKFWGNRLSGNGNSTLAVGTEDGLTSISMTETGWKLYTQDFFASSTADHFRIAIPGVNRFAAIDNVELYKIEYVTGLLVQNDSMLSFYPPTGMTGVAQVHFENFSGISTSGSFTFINKPFISGFAPAFGAVNSYILMSGSGMRNVTGFRFGAYNGTFVTGNINGVPVISGLIPNVLENPEQNFNISLLNEAGSSTTGTFRLTHGELTTYGLNVIGNSRFSGATIQSTVPFVPANMGDTAGVSGQFIFTDSYIYYKTSVGWKRASLISF